MVFYSQREEVDVMFRYIKVTNAQKKILQATLQLLERDGYQSLTVRKICEEAGCALGTFYHSFKNRDDILSFLILNEHNRFREENREELSQLDPVERITETISATLMYFTSLGTGVMEEYFTPKNKAMNYSAFGRSDQRYIIVDGIKEDLKLAAETGLIKDAERDGEDFINRLVLEIENIFYGTIFNWSINDGGFDIDRVFRREMKIFLHYYKA
ncbi:MAG: TetR/AcrR family transcriptional regulator [Ruminiclostridium sp.]|nr:TetR/AcrR family transcriptional regulator [Ruminiclostridium sp.]